MHFTAVDENGTVLADGVQIGDFFGFGRLPYNDRQADSTPRNHEFAIDNTVSQIVLRVHDITDLSEIYVDNVVVTGVPEPSLCALLAFGGLAGLCTRRTTRKKFIDSTIGAPRNELA